MPFKKGSQEMKDHMARIRLKKGDPRLKNINKKKKVKSQIKQAKEFVMDVPIFGDPKLAVPEFMAVENDDGTMNLVNPLTNARNLATRNSNKSIVLVRKPLKKSTLEKSGMVMKVPLSKFKKEQRDKVREFYKNVLANEGKPVDQIRAIGSFRNAERGRPETLPKNIKVNSIRAKEAKKNNTSPKHHSTIRKKGKTQKEQDDEDFGEEGEDSEEEEESDEEKPKKETKPRKKRVSKYDGLTDQPYVRMKPLPKDATPEEKAERRKLVRRMSMARARANAKAEGSGISAKDLKALHTSAYKKDRDKTVGDYELDESISKPTASVYVNKKTKQPIVVHRGTEGTLSDWANNLAYVTGHSKKTQRYKDSEKVQKDAEAKYGDTLTTGHSQGGIYSKLARNKKGIIDVNPASLGEVANEGTTIRSKTDPVSLLAGVRNMFSKNKKNITTSGKVNPLSAHSLDILDELGDTELGNGLGNKGKGIPDGKYFRVGEDKIYGNDIMPMNMMGCGGVHHHYHIMPNGSRTSNEIMTGQGIESMFRDLGKYVQPVADAGMDRAMKEIRGNGIEDLFRDAGRYIQPVTDAGIDRAIKEIKGNGIESMFRDLGKYVQPVADAGIDRAIKEIKGRGRKGGRFVKGSKEAKEYMASIRNRK